MTIQTEKILALSKDDEFTAQLILTIDVLGDIIKDHSARIKKLEAREQETAKTPLKLVQNDGSC